VIAVEIVDTLLVNTRDKNKVEGIEMWWGTPGTKKAGVELALSMRYWWRYEQYWEAVYFPMLPLVQPEKE
jgi:hypothetical protein